MLLRYSSLKEVKSIVSVLFCLGKTFPTVILIATTTVSTALGVLLLLLVANWSALRNHAVNYFGSISLLGASKSAAETPIFSLLNSSILLERRGEDKLLPPTSKSRESFSAKYHRRGLKEAQRIPYEELVKHGLLGEWVLIELRAPKEKQNAPKLEDRFEFVLCRLAQGLRAADPPGLAFFDRLAAVSRCGEARRRRTLGWAGAEEYLAQSQVVHPTGFIHHETRCGSTLVTNILASNPKILAYSEPKVLLDASYNMCKECPWEFRVRLLRLAAGLMGVISSSSSSSPPPPAPPGGDDAARRARPTHLFFKLGRPATALALELYKAAFPKTPYIWMHREPVEVMRSLLIRPQKKFGDNRYNWQVLELLEQHQNATEEQLAAARDDAAPCLRPLPQVAQVLSLKEDSDYATREKYCAVFLQITCKAALKAMAGDPWGLPVAYTKDLAQYFIEFILPEFFKVYLQPNELQQAYAISGLYSKGHPQRGQKDDGFETDAIQKHKTAWHELINCADQYVRPAYNDLVDMEKMKVDIMKKKKRLPA